MRRSTMVGTAIAAVAAGGAIISKVLSRTNDVPFSDLPTTPPVGEPNVDGEAFLEHLGEAVRLPTVADGDTDPRSDLEAFHRFLEVTYPEVDRVCDRTMVSGHAVLYRWGGTDADAAPLVLMAHMDVVPVEVGTESDWQFEPFSGTVADGHLWGRGALDDKGPLIAMMEAVEHLARSGFTPRRTIYLAFGHDEEVGGTQGARAIARHLRGEGVEPWFVLDEGGAVIDLVPGLTTDPVALVKIAEKGYVDVQLTASGEGGHSSLPPRSSAIGTLAEAIAALEHHPLQARVEVLVPLFRAIESRLDAPMRTLLSNLTITAPLVTRSLAKRPQTDALMRTSTAVTMVSGGVKPNVLPQEATALVNFRILPGDTVQGVLDHVRDVVGPNIAIEAVGDMRSEPSRYSSTESDAWHVVGMSVEETFPGVTVAPWILTGATDSRYFMDFAGDVYGFAPFTMDLDDHGIHGTNERIRTGDAAAAVSFFCRLIRNAQTPQE